MNDISRSPFQRISEIGMGYIHTKALCAVARLGIADLIGDDEASGITDLAKATDTDEQALYRVMRLLAGLGVFREEAGKVFAHTEMSECLREQHEQSARHRLMFWGEEQYEAFEEILHSLRTGKPAFDLRYDAPVFDYLKTHDEVNKRFQSSMRNSTRSDTGAILDAYDFSGFTRIVDVGGGNGTLLSGILCTCPEVAALLFDRANTIELARTGVGGPLPRCEFVAGDFFDEIPAGGDLYTLKRIIHDWESEDAVSILRNCRKAMGENAKLLIIEDLVGPPNRHTLANQRDITMLVIVGGLERRQEEYRSLLEQADLKLDRIFNTETDISILEAHAE